MGVFVFLITVVVVVWWWSEYTKPKEEEKHGRRETEKAPQSRSESYRAPVRNDPPPRNRAPAGSSGAPTNRAPRTTNTYRPSASTKKTGSITFSESTSVRTSIASGASDISLSGLHDALTGAVLDATRGLFHCTTCKVFYHSDSLELLRAENDGQCVSCQSRTLVSFASSQVPRSGKNFTPVVVTLSDYHKHVGAVVTFEGTVPIVRESRRGKDFAVMFEDKPWKDGFKLVFFRGAVKRSGGSPYIHSLKNRRIRVRGLVIKHPTFGYEIVVTEQGMILAVH